MLEVDVEFVALDLRHRAVAELSVKDVGAEHYIGVAGIAEADGAGAGCLRA